MRQKLALIAVLAAILTLGLIFASCDNPLSDGNGDITGGDGPSGDGDENTILLAMGNGGVAYKFTVSQTPANVAVGDDIAGAMLSLSGSTKSFSGTIAEKESMIDGWKIKFSISIGGDTVGQSFYLTLDNEGNLIQIEGDIPMIDSFSVKYLNGPLAAIGEIGTDLDGVWSAAGGEDAQFFIFDENVLRAVRVGDVWLEVNGDGEIIGESGESGSGKIKKDRVMKMNCELTAENILKITNYCVWRYMENAFGSGSENGDWKISVDGNTLAMLPLPSDWETNGVSKDSKTVSSQKIKDMTLTELIDFLDLQEGQYFPYNRHTIDLP